MNLQAVEQAKIRLAKAEKTFDAMRSSTTLEDMEEAWTDFLIAVSAIYSKLEQGAKGNSKSEGWFGRKKRERRKDPLLKYLHAARNSNEHGIERIVESTCPYQKLRPTVLVVQATEDAHWNDPPDPVDRSMDWGVFVQRQVSPSFVVIRDVACDDAAEVSLAEHDEMVETLPPDRAD